MLAYKKDCSIQISDSKKLLDGEGNVLHKFAGDTPDELIWEALAWANNAHDMGIQNGKLLKMAEIRKAIGLNYNPPRAMDGAGENDAETAD